MRTVAVCVAVVAVACPLPPVAGRDDKPPPKAPKSQKKGVGLAESHGLGVKQLEALHAHWYYNWSDHSKVATGVEFVPMIYALKNVDAKVTGNIVLGFNEPDNEKQADIAVKAALEAWPKVTEKAKLVGSPATASNPVTGDWLPAFMKAKPKVDFVTVHWYKGVDPKHFVKDIEAVHAAYDKPVWVTEFAPQTAASSRAEPDKFTQKQVDGFVAEVVGWMEKTPYVHRYAWHDSRAGTSALFDDKGALTPTGKAYAASR